MTSARGFDAVLMRLATGQRCSAASLAGCDGFTALTPGQKAGFFRYGVASGYLLDTLDVEPKRRPGKGWVSVKVYVRTDTPIEGIEKSCVWCGTTMTRGVLPSGRAEAWSRFRRRAHCSRECQAADRDSTALALRTVVARTCVSCGEFKDGLKFNRTGTSTDSTCIACRSARYVSTLAPTELRRRRRDKIENRKGTVTYTGAARNGFHWTGPEIELLDREDLSTRRIAEMVQRTPYAVQEQRRLLHKGDPQVLLLLSGPSRQQRRRDS